MASANVYVDGFNLYYGIRNRFPECKWLDVRKLAEIMYPPDTIQRVRYFTARVTARPDDPSQPQRQQAYLRALETIDVDLHYGLFKSHQKRMKRASQCSTPGCLSPDKTDVLFTEEKGSDVALGSYLLRDAFAKEMNVAIVITNDTDLETPLKLARDELGMQIALVSPSKHAHESLRAHAHSVKTIRRKPLLAAQLPPSLIDGGGRIIHCPAAWRNAP
jgi:uncharacterized LabA/DUF88 family protein